MVVNSVVAWSFYPKLLTREGKGWRNVANNQSVTLHPTSVNKRADSAVKWLSYYHIMQARNRNLNAHETSAVDDFAIALLCGDAEFKVRAYFFFSFRVMMLISLFHHTDVRRRHLHRLQPSAVLRARLEIDARPENPQRPPP